MRSGCDILVPVPAACFPFAREAASVIGTTMEPHLRGGFGNHGAWFLGHAGPPRLPPCELASGQRDA